MTRMDDKKSGKEPYTGRMRSLISMIRSQMRSAIIIFLILMLVTGLAYPLVVTGVAQLAFPHQANGSQIISNGTIVGSEIIGQPFNESKYFWGRPSATTGFPYNASLSSGSNFGPNNPSLQQMEQARIDALHAADPNNTLPIPSDLVTASGSGLDPHISPAAAEYQVTRVAKARGMDVQKVKELVAQNTQGRWLGFIGDPTVNVLKLNLALDSAK